MTDAQREVFCNAAQMGIACGLEHRYEWYTNAIRSLAHGAYSEIPSRAQALDEAFVAFEKGTGSCPEETDGLFCLDAKGYRHMVNNWYDRVKGE